MHTEALDGFLFKRRNKTASRNQKLLLFVPFSKLHVVPHSAKKKRTVKRNKIAESDQRSNLSRI